MPSLRDYMPTRTYAIVCAYSSDGIKAQVAGCAIGRDDGLSLTFPKAHPFVQGDKVTVHLDNRTGVETFDIELRVYRTSYKGIVDSVSANHAEVRPVHYQLIYSTKSIAEYRAPDYRFPPDDRLDGHLPPSRLKDIVVPDDREASNNLGVWITRAEERPHTTVMAFLSTPQDDIFLISHRGTFKSGLIHRDRRCCFAIDHRATYLFEKAVDWNFSIIKAEASLIDRSSPQFETIQALFVQKNPWEEPFFTDPKVEVFHLSPLGLICAGAPSSAY
jgi:hypothetical protein